MDRDEAMRERHSVRSFTDQPIPAETIASLQAEIDACNAEGDLNLQLVLDEPEAFNGFIGHYGHFSGVRNYICCVGRKSKTLEERVGYYGERVVLLARMLGLDTCWVALTYSKNKIGYKPKLGERVVCVIPLGFGTTHGVPHKNHDIATRFRTDGEAPDWFLSGMDAAMLAPTAVNQQKFAFWLTDGNKVRAEATGGSYSKTDLGIAKYHFELGAGTENFVWDE